MTSEAPKYLAAKPRLIYRSYGLEKVGKDHFGLTMPGPYVKHLFDPGGLEGVADKFLDQKDIRVYTYKRVDKRVFKDKSRKSQAWEEAKRQRDAFIENLEASIGWARSISVDETDLWSLFRFAEFGIESDAPKNYDVLNDDYRQMIQVAVDARVNFQLIQKMKVKWATREEERITENGQKVKKQVPYETSEFTPVGMKELQYIVQANVRHFWTKAEGFGIEVANCRQNMQVAGETFLDCDFPTLAQMVFPESDEGHWA